MASDSVHPRSPMKIDIAGRVRNTKLPKGHALQPLFEAVVNSIHAIEDFSEDGVGNITITVLRDGQLRTDSDVVVQPVVSFEIEDNGVGFNNTNFESFLTADSAHKQERGGKGVGRFLWLKAFDRVKIDSVYVEAGQKWRRTFEFLCTPAGVENHNNEHTSQDATRITRVTLVNYRFPYIDHCPRTTTIIARRVVEHCLEFFLFTQSPRIYLVDNGINAKHNLNQLFEDEFKPAANSRSFTVGNEVFSLQDVMIHRPSDTIHQVRFCAHHRVVSSERLSGKISHLEGMLHDNANGPFVYSAYISSRYLDDRVENDRTGFRIPEKPMALIPEEISWPQIQMALIDKVKEYLLPFTAATRAKAMETVEMYIQEDAPLYKHLLSSDQDSIQDLSPNLHKSQLEIELFKLHYQKKLDLKREASNQLHDLDEKDWKDWKEHRLKFEEFFRNLNELAKAELAEYVVHRKTVLSFMERLFGLTDGGNYAREEAIH